jgi:hypothetical protein
VRNNRSAGGPLHRAWLWAALVFTAAAATAFDDVRALTAELVSGEPVARPGLLSIIDGKLLFTDGSSLSLDDVRVIRFANLLAAKAVAGPVVHLAGGGLLPVRDAILVEDACEATLRDGRKATLELGDVAGIQLADTADAVWKDALARPSDEHDVVVLKAEPQATAVRAFVETVGPETVEFDWDRQTRKIGKSQLVGIVFARTEMPAKAPLKIHTADGAVLPASRIEPTEDPQEVRCTLAHGSSFAVPLSQMASIAVRSLRIRSLSELTPAAVVERPIVTLPRGWKADANVRGEPLRAGPRTFEQGIGVQSGTSLTYDLDGQAAEFAAVLFVDSPQGTTGDCEFVVLADGQEVARRHLTSADDPANLRAPLGGARRLELRVEYGANLDFGDHANWCDAHLVRTPESIAHP